MSAVTKYLAGLIEQQVKERGLVVWYDPERAYKDITKTLLWPDTTFVCYDGSFIKLRREIDLLMNDTTPPRLVVYVPLDREETSGALIELDSAGVVMQPRQQPPACNTRLSVVARKALKPILSEEQILEIESQVESGKLTLSDLNSLAEQGMDISTGILKLLFGTANPQEVALDFLHSESFDSEIQKKDAANELNRLLQASFDIRLDAASSFSVWRDSLGRHVLVTELLSSLHVPAPSSLESVSKAQSTAGVEACSRLARAWRNSREHRDSYILISNQVEHELSSIDQLWADILERRIDKRDSGSGIREKSPDQQERVRNLFRQCETFVSIEKALLEFTEQSLAREATAELLQLAKSRISGFWSDVRPAIQARWALLSSAADVLLEADRVEQELKTFIGQSKSAGHEQSTTDLIKAYSEGDMPWCMLDTYHRHLESRKYSFEFATGDDHKSLEKLIARAEQRYTEVGSKLSKQFVTHFAKAKHPIQGQLRQRDLFEKQVKPQLGEEKVAYVWVDALRYEMARELSRLLMDDFKVKIRPAIGTIPTITEIGMAALLPNAHRSLKVVGVGGGKLALEIEGQVIKDRKDRVTYLREHAGVSVFDAKLDDLLPKPNRKIKDGIQNHQLILITSQEIDELGEADNVSQARLQIDGVLSHLRRGVRVLADHGVKTIILAADHGHLFADEMGEDMKIEAPGGKAEDLHRRVWVGVGGTSEPSYLRTPLANLGVDSEFDVATPWTFAVFKSKGGGRAYFHGGLSPQELIIPVVILRSSAKRLATSTGTQWTLKPGTPKLTTRFFSVQISGKQTASSLFGFEPPKVRIELRANKKCVSVPVSASYGFEDATGEIKLRLADTDNKTIEPNTITVMLSEEIAQKTVGVYLVDAITGAELVAPLTIDVAISM